MEGEQKTIEAIRIPEIEGVISALLRREVISMINAFEQSSAILLNGSQKTFIGVDVNLVKTILNSEKVWINTLKARLSEGKISIRQLEEELTKKIDQFRRTHINAKGKMEALEDYINQCKEKLALDALILKKIAHGENFEDLELPKELKDRYESLKKRFHAMQEWVIKAVAASNNKGEKQQANTETETLSKLIAEARTLLEKAKTNGTTIDIDELAKKVAEQALAIIMEKLKKDTKMAEGDPEPTSKPNGEENTAENYEEKKKQAIDWVNKNMQENGKNQNYWIAMALAENFDKEITSEQIDQYLNAQGTKYKSKVSVMIVNVSTSSKTFKDGPYKIERNSYGAMGANGRAIASYRLTLKNIPAASPKSENDDDNEPENITEKSLEWIEKNIPQKRKDSNIKAIALFLASNYGTIIQSSDSELQKLAKGRMQEVKKLIELLKELNAPYKIVVTEMKNPKGTGHPINAYTWTTR